MQRKAKENERYPGARLVAAAMLLAALAGCSFGPPPRNQPLSYDLGPLPAVRQVNPGIRAVIMVPPVAAPAPLDGTGIVYRLAYVDPARAEVYAESRWAERMSVLLTQRVKSHMAGIAAGVVSPADGARADYVLRMELEDFSQHFDSAAASRAVVRVRAVLVDAGSRSLRAQRTFSAERPAGANAASGVKALAEAADIVIAELGAWTVRSASADGR